MLRVLSLFAGIGGFDLGLERTGGFETVAFCEIDPFCRRVLAKHWPNVRQYDDVKTLTADTLARDGIAVDVICGGFPCQDISKAGSGAGLDGKRSSLWFEYARLIGELRPKFVIVENVSALLGRGLDRVLGDLAAIGLDAEWHCVPAASVGAPHIRDRVWIIAYPQHSHADGFGSHRETEHHGRAELRHEQGCLVGSLGQDVADADIAGLEVLLDRKARELSTAIGAHSWGSEPDVGRVAYGVPARVDRIKSLGNAVVPQIPEMIGRAILSQLEAA